MKHLLIAAALLVTALPALGQNTDAVTKGDLTVQVISTNGASLAKEGLPIPPNDLCLQVQVIITSTNPAVAAFRVSLPVLQDNGANVVQAQDVARVSGAPSIAVFKLPTSSKVSGAVTIIEVLAPIEFSTGSNGD